MPSEFRLTVRFLQPYSHGRGEYGEPEWPPSPLRLFQAIVASSVGRQVDTERRGRTIEALRWLERQEAPEIVAPVAKKSNAPYRLFLPDNIGDRVGKAWSSGRDASLNDDRTQKDVRPLRLQGEAVHYIFRDIDGLEDHFAVLRAAARSITHLGWGIDMVVGDARDDTRDIVGERWIPGRYGGPTLRCPVEGTFDALEHQFARFLRRLEGGTFNPVPPLSAFATERYARAADIAPRPFIAFRLLDPVTGDQMSLDPRRRAPDIAAWTRHAVSEVCEGWPFGSTKMLVHGHEDGSDPRADRCRISFRPLPTINPRLHRVERVGRVMIVAPPEYERQLAWIDSRLAGRELVWEDTPIALLEPLPPGDWVVNQYVGRAECWSTVTPVVLPGHIDGSARKAERILRKAFLHAGFEPETVDTIQQLEWRAVGFRAGADLAHRYRTPDKVSGPMFHVRVRFGQPIAGPIALGSGRHRGLGVFATEQ